MSVALAVLGILGAAAVTGLIGYVLWQCDRDVWPSPPKAGARR